MSRDLSTIGSALAAPARSAFLNLLMDGSTRPASELAAFAGVSASTASQHLTVLLDAGLVSCVPRGRHRFYALAGAEVAAALEQLGQLCPPSPAVTETQRRAGRGLVHARLCYDHLAGQLGVAVADAMIANNWVDPALTTVTAAGLEHLAAGGLDVPALPKGRRPLLRPCPDWTERRPHVAGALGAAIATHFAQQGWIRRRPHGRGLVITDDGADSIRSRWNVELDHGAFCVAGAVRRTP